MVESLCTREVDYAESVWEKLGQGVVYRIVGWNSSILTLM